MWKILHCGNPTLFEPLCFREKNNTYFILNRKKIFSISLNQITCFMDINLIFRASVDMMILNKLEIMFNLITFFGKNRNWIEN